MEKHLIKLILFVIILIGVASAGLDVGLDEDAVVVEIETPTTATNYSIQNTNSSDFWDLLDTPADINTADLTDDNTYVQIIGDIMTGNLIGTWFNGSFNWTITDDWNSFDGSTLNFNESKLSTVYYNATQSIAVVGTIDGGDLSDTHHQDGSYDGTTFNFSETATTPGLDLRMNFTDIEEFNRGVMRYKTSDLKGDFPLVQLWNYDDSVWEDYPQVSESDSFATMTQPVFDDSDHVGTGVDDGVVQMRIYKSSLGNTQNNYYVDWIAISKGYGTPSGQEVDPFFESWLNDPVFDNNVNATGYNFTGDYYCVGSNCYDDTFWYNMTLATFLIDNLNISIDNRAGNVTDTTDLTNVALLNDTNQFEEEQNFTTSINIGNWTINETGQFYSNLSRNFTIEFNATHTIIKF